MKYIPDNPLVNSSGVVAIFFSKILVYFSFLVLAFIPCHGNSPFKKYISTYPKDSKSSLLLCSVY